MENVSALTTAIELLNKQSDGLLTSFGRLAESSKTWNIVSRLLSGSGLWQLQNRIRAIGNIMNLYNINLANSLQTQMDAVSSAKQMADAISGLKAEQDSLMNSEYFDALEKIGYNWGPSFDENWYGGDYWDDYLGEYYGPTDRYDKNKRYKFVT